MSPNPVIIERRDAYVPLWPQEQFIVPLLGKHIRHCLDTWAKDGHGLSVLDVGCGSQPLRATLESRGFVYRSMDIVKAADVDVDFIAAIDEALPPALVSVAPFDLVLCTEVLEHVAEWTPAFQNLAALTRRGGRVIVTSPFFYQLHEVPQDFWRPTLFAFRHYAEKHGFTVLFEEAAGDAWDVIGTVLPNAKPRSIGERFWHGAAAACLRYAFRVVRALLKRRLPQRAVRLGGSLYLSNIVVLERA